MFGLSLFALIPVFQALRQPELQSLGPKPFLWVVVVDLSGYFAIGACSADGWWLSHGVSLGADLLIRF